MNKAARGSTYIVEDGAVKDMFGARDGEELDYDTQIIQVLCSDSSSRPQGFVVVMRRVVVGNQEQAPGGEVGRLCGEDLVCTEQDVGHRYRFVGRLKELVGLVFIVDEITQTFDISSSRNIQVSQKIAVWVREASGGAGFILEARLFSAEEKDAHHIVRIGYDALLHQRVGAFQGSNGRSITIGLFRFLLRRFSEHGRADIDSEENSIFDGFVALSVISSCLFTRQRIKCSTVSSMSSSSSSSS